jgi:metaxin
MPSIIPDQLRKQESLADDNSEIVLYQPYEVEQILLAENASCLAVKTYFKMVNRPFTVKMCANAEFMSSGGHQTKLPVLKYGCFIAAEFDPIVNLLEQKEISLTSHLNENQKFELRPLIRLTEKIFTNAELYISWIDKKVLEEITYPRNGSVFPWPLNHIQNFRKRRHVLKQLDLFDWKNLSIDEVQDQVDKCCNMLSVQLAENSFFYGNSPTELDALVFGHLFSIFTMELPNTVLAQTVNKYTNLVAFCKRIETAYFKKL